LANQHKPAYLNIKVLATIVSALTTFTPGYEVLHRLVTLDSFIFISSHRGIRFPSDDSAKKLSTWAAAKNGQCRSEIWKLALNRFKIKFEDRLADYI
jgi:hypothetical protein